MKKAIAGVGPDTPIVEHPSGGKHSRINASFHLLPAAAICAIAGVLHEGEKRHEEQNEPNSLSGNWRKLPQHVHLNHSIQHLFAFLAGDTQEDHLAHAACRLLFAIERAVE